MSVVWSEGEAAYSFFQMMNPGPSLLSPIDWPEAKMKKRVAEIVRIQESLAKIAAIPAGERRATEAAAYVRSDVHEARGGSLPHPGRVRETGTPFFGNCSTRDRAFVTTRPSTR